MVLTGSVPTLAIAAAKAGSISSSFSRMLARLAASRSTVLVEPVEPVKPVRTPVAVVVLLSAGMIRSPSTLEVSPICMSTPVATSAEPLTIA